MPITPAQYEHLAEEMLAIYEQAEQRMLAKVSARLAKGIDSPGWTERKYAEVSAARKELKAELQRIRKSRDPVLKGVVEAPYSAGRQASITDIAKLAIDVSALPGADPITALSPSAKRVSAILKELEDKIGAADRVILRKANDIYTSVIAQVSAQVATGTITVREAVQRELAMFADKGITGFVDAAGNRWEMATYAEMATITAIENAALAGYVETMQEYGFDLAVISSHEGACPLCVAWEGVVVSVSGTDKKYPSLDDARAGGAFHPRCMHHLSTYYEGITKGTRSKPRSVNPPTQSYSVRQKQRYCERMIRKWKRRMAASIDPQEERTAFARVRSYQQEIRELIASSSDVLPRKYWREGGVQRLSPEAKKLRPVVLK